jgi:hypothetical protein
MRQGTYRDAMEEIFKNDPTKLDRLYRMTQDAADIIGHAVATSSAGAARIDTKAARAELSTQGLAGRLERARLSFWENFWRLAGLAGGHFMLRMVGGLGGAASLSIPMRLGRFGREAVVSAWLAERGEALSILKDATMNPEFEVWLRNSAPGNFQDQAAHFKRTLRYVRRLEAATNEDIHGFLVGHGDRAYAEDLRRAREQERQIRGGLPETQQK